MYRRVPENNIETSDKNKTDLIFFTDLSTHHSVAVRMAYLMIQLLISHVRLLPPEYSGGSNISCETEGC